MQWPGGRRRSRSAGPTSGPIRPTAQVRPRYYGVHNGPMPELPEVEALASGLATRMAGKRIERGQLASFAALKTFDPPLEQAVGRTVSGVERRGKFVCIDTDGLWLVVHLARGGWIRWHETVPSGAVRPGKSPIALRVTLDDRSGFDLTEMGTEKRLAIWVVHRPEEVEPLAALGVDPLSPAFTVEHLAGVLADSSATLKSALTSQSLIAGVGNAYSDEALHRARLSPYKHGGKLDTDEVARLHDAVVDVLAEAVDRAGAARHRRAQGRQEALHAGPRPRWPTLSRVRGHHPTGLLRHQVPAVLPQLPDGGQAPGRPAALPPAQVTTSTRRGPAQQGHRGRSIRLRPVPAICASPYFPSIYRGHTNRRGMARGTGRRT